MFEFVFPVLTFETWRLGAGAAFLALALDLLFGEPKWLYARISHPVVWIGGLISVLDIRLHRPGDAPWVQLVRGAALVGLVVAPCIVAGAVIAWLGAKSGHGWIVSGVIGSIFLAARGLHDHVAAVARGLSQGLEQGRGAVGHIVGREPGQLDEAGVARAALESLAENFSDAVVAPLFWLLLAGLPGLLAYKAINTLDSMVGHRNRRYLYFGRIAARLDDGVNWPAARIAGLLLCLGACVTPGARGAGAWRIMWRDRGGHRSPNAGWPEGAMAGALGLALAGPRVYDGKLMDGAWIGDGTEAGRQDIARGCNLYRWSCGLLAVALLLAALP